MWLSSNLPAARRSLFVGCIKAKYRHSSIAISAAITTRREKSYHEARRRTPLWFIALFGLGIVGLSIR
jgi:hypothetical protein